MPRASSPSNFARTAVLVVVAAAFASCAQENGTQVTIVSGQRFNPSELEVEAGATVDWVSEAGDAHTVTADEESLPDAAEYFASGGFPNEEAARDHVASGLLTEGETYSVTFDTPGTYRYLCIPHEGQGMSGVIVVGQ